MTAIMINGEVVRRSQWDAVRLAEGDAVELIVAAAGG
jgi:thiamine biosynthesis protein ThiS